ALQQQKQFQTHLTDFSAAVPHDRDAGHAELPEPRVQFGPRPQVGRAGFAPLNASARAESSAACSRSRSSAAWLPNPSQRTTPGNTNPWLTSVTTITPKITKRMRSR